MNYLMNRSILRVPAWILLLVLVAFLATPALAGVGDVVMSDGRDRMEGDPGDGLENSDGGGLILPPNGQSGMSGPDSIRGLDIRTPLHLYFVFVVPNPGSMWESPILLNLSEIFAWEVIE